MARAGKVVADMHEACGRQCAPGVTTAQLDEIAERECRSRGGHPVVQGLRRLAAQQPRRHPAFPATLCTSVNEEIVHGIPSPRRVLREGDLIKIDAGAIVDGLPRRLRCDVDRRRGRRRAARGHAPRPAPRAPACGPACRQPATTRAWATSRRRSRPRPCRTATAWCSEYVGHGIGRALHEDPHVPNYGTRRARAQAAAGLVLAIEPMFNLGTPTRAVLDDDWTVVTADGAPSSHWEHTVAITPDGPWVLTARVGRDRVAAQRAGPRSGSRRLPDSAARPSGGVRPGGCRGLSSALHAAGAWVRRPPTMREKYGEGQAVREADLREVPRSSAGTDA